MPFSPAIIGVMNNYDLIINESAILFCQIMIFLLLMVLQH